MPLSDAQLEIILIDVDGNYVLVTQGQVVSGSGAGVRPFFLAGGVKPDGTAAPILVDASGDLIVKAE